MSSKFNDFLNEQLQDPEIKKEYDDLQPERAIIQALIDARLRTGMTQKELAEKLNISFQAVSKWENGDALPDTGLLPDLCNVLNTTADKLLNGGAVLLSHRRLMRVEDVITGFECMEAIGKYLGESSDFFTGMVEGINEKMNIDLLAYLKDPRAREVMYAEALIQGILSGCTVDMEEVIRVIHSDKMRETIRRYLDKAGGKQ